MEKKAAARFAQRVVVLIGAATGLGRSMAQQFAREGARLVLADVDRETLASTLQRVVGDSPESIAIPTDVLRKDQIDALAARTLEHFGSVDIVCYNAGVNEYLAPAWEKSAADWEWVMGVNLYGLVHTANAFIPIMLKQGRGHLVSTASNSSLLSASGVAVYVASKKANLGFCEALQFDLRNAGSDVKVSVICPNKIASDMPNSARNRPASLAGRVPTAEEVKFMSQYLAAGGHTPDEAAAIVLDGIAEQRFYVLTNPIDGKHVQEWAAGVATGSLLAPKIDPVASKR